jgi:hypothetical protein
MIVGIVGFIGAGKDTVAQVFKDNGYKHESFANPLKDAVSHIFGWPKEMLEGKTEASRKFREASDPWWSSKLGFKTFTPRLALQLIGTEVFRDSFNPNIWLHSLENRYVSSGMKKIVISDCRFKNEVSLIKSLGGYLIKVQRGGTPHWYEMAVEAASGDAFSQHSLAEMGIHQSEWDWVNQKIDYEIHNNSTIEDLQLQTQQIIEKINSNRKTVDKK